MPEPVNMVFLVDSLKRGGVQVGVLLQAARLDPALYSARVWALRSGDKNWEIAEDFRKAGVAVDTVSVRHPNDRPGLLELARKLSKERIALLNTRSFHPNIIGRIAARMARVPAIVAHYESTYSHQWNSKVLPYEYLLREGTDAFVCVSRAVRDYLTPLLRLPEDRIHVVYNGLDVAEFAKPQDRVAAREALGLPTDKPIVGMVGRLTQVKDVPTLIRCAPRVAEKMPGVQFVLVGDGEERERILNLIRICGLHRSVLLLGSQSDMPSVFAAMDCVVMPSLVEGFPRTLLECFASRTPIVATLAGGIAEILRDGENGLVIPMANPDALADAIVRTLQSPEETRNRCERAFQDVQAFDATTWMRSTQELFDRAVARHQAAIAVLRKSPPMGGTLRLELELVKFRVSYRMARHGGRAPS